MQANEKLDVEPFRLSATTRDQPSEFEIAIVEGGVRYQFGFAATRNRIVEEWLFAYPNYSICWSNSPQQPTSKRETYAASRNLCKIFGR